MKRDKRRRKKPQRMHKKSTDTGITLPVTITSIKPQKKRSGRFSLYHDDQFIIGVSTDTLIAFNLNKGVVINCKLFEQLSAEEEVNTVRNYMLKLLGRRSHSGGELKTKALRKGYRQKHIDSVLNELRRKKYLNDEEFARRYVSDKLNIQHWGPVKISSELARKGIDPKTVKKALSEITDGLELKQICVDLALRRKHHFSGESDNFKREQKIAAYLRRRGFTYNTINSAIPDISSRINV